MSREPAATPRIAITGLGVVTAPGVGLAAFRDALRSGRACFGPLRRPGREGAGVFIGAEIDDEALVAPVSRGLWRTLPLSTRAALVAALEAIGDADLPARGFAPHRLGLVVGGDGFQQRPRELAARRFREHPAHVLPSYGLSFWDSDLAGVLSQELGFAGECYHTGGASAGGAVAVIHAARQVLCGRLDAAVAVGPLCDLSALELQALANLGALGGAAFHDRPERACRPFDRDRDGFVFGEGCAALVLERAAEPDPPSARRHGYLLGWGLARDAHRGPEPDTRGQQRAIVEALAMAGLAPAEIDYVNPHGSGSPLGDATEIETLRAAGLERARLNTTKSLTGHCLTAAGALEAAATLVQLGDGFLHPSRNLEHPADEGLRWVRDAGLAIESRYALSLSFAFAGLSTALVLSRSFS